MTKKFEPYSGESLIRPPKGFDRNHPLIETLKQKSFMRMRYLVPQRIHTRALIDDAEESFTILAPHMRFLTNALDLPF